MFRARNIGLVTVACLVATTLRVTQVIAQENQGTASQHVVVVLDDSGSMNERMRSNRSTTRMQAAKQSLITVLDSLPADSQVGVVTLNGGWKVQLGPINKAAAKKAIRSIGAKGGTPLGRFMKHGTDALLNARQKDHYGSYRLLIVTDGEAGDQELVEKFLPDILSRGVTTDVIGVDMQSDHSLATAVHTYRRADDPDSLTQAVREVFAETSANTSDAGEDDFDLVAGIPDEVAHAALEALAESGNHPIGGVGGVGTVRPAANSSSSASSTTNSANPAPPPWAKPANPPARRRPFNPIFIVMLLFIGSILLNVVKGALKKP